MGGKDTCVHETWVGIKWNWEQCSLTLLESLHSCLVWYKMWMQFNNQMVSKKEKLYYKCMQNNNIKIFINRNVTWWVALPPTSLHSTRATKLSPPSPEQEHWWHFNLLLGLHMHGNAFVSFFFFVLLK